MSTLAPIASIRGFNCPFCGQWTKTEIGGGAHMRSCKFRDATLGEHTAQIRYSRGSLGSGAPTTILTCSCATGQVGVNLGHAVGATPTGLAYLTAIFGIHRSTGKPLLDIANGDY